MLIDPAAIVEDYAALALARATRRAYASDLADFQRYCAETGHAEDLPAAPAVVAAYLAAHAASLASATLARRLRALKAAHRARGLALDTADPLIRRTLAGIARRHGTPPRQAAALGTREVVAMVRACPPDLTGRRDAALLLVGFAGGLRRSEITGIDVEHLTFVPAGVRLLLARSKTDQEGQGTEIMIPAGNQRDTCPVRALERWLELAAINFGPAFRGIDRWGGISDARLHDDGVRRIVSRAAARAGIVVARHETISPHGLRAGFVTEAYRAGARPEDIMAHSRHQSYEAMRGYIRRSHKAADNPARLLGL